MNFKELIAFALILVERQNLSLRVKLILIVDADSLVILTIPKA